VASAEVLTAEGVDVALVNVDRLAAECADIDILVNTAGAILGGNIRADRRGALAPGLGPPKAPKSLETSRCPLTH